ncbi:YhgE/Pip domain-containing protein [Bacillus massiliglaciei]|uniref:YhgE/Pip domain-containing protein n=1 Tax=Bacillus massiliglaciei TaxID=1816693 RepID=UPI000AB9DDFA|nr:YhgE/Pip domain-containing protein [Bacillus massiliglaciei]
MKRELKEIFTNRKLLIPIIAILFIPIMYGGMLLWAFWNPYDKLENLPVAIVNNDKGAEMDGHSYQLGDEFVKNLKESKEFNFKFVDKKQGYRNLADQKYYLLVEIPESFSKNATTLLDEKPKKLELKYVPNESYNFLSSQIGEKAIQKIQMSLQEKVTETYAETMFDNMKKMADGFQFADEGAGKLLNGAENVEKGSKTMEEKLALLAEKQVEFTNGTDKVANGTKELQKGIESLNSGLGQLSDGQSQLVEGSKKAEEGTASLTSGIQQTHEGIRSLEGNMGSVVSGTQELKGGSDKVAAGLQELEKGSQTAADTAVKVDEGLQALQAQLAPVIAGLPEENKAAVEAAFQQLSEGTAGLAQGNKNISASAGQLADGSAEISNNLAKINEGQSALYAGIQKLSGGAAQLESGAGELQKGQSQLTAGLETFSSKLNEAKAGSEQLAAGAADLTNGAGQLGAGSKQLADGSSQIADGAVQLSDGSKELTNGSKEFKNEISEAAKESSDVKANDDTYNMVAEPVKVEKESVNEVPNYGTGIAPYFLSLGLFVGALLISIVFPFEQPVGVPKNGVTWFLSKFGIAAGIGIIQALIACAILLEFIGLEVQSVPLFITFTVITSLTFVTLIQLLVTTMGDPGRFLAIIILILQLTTSAGTFPVELIPDQLQVFNHLLPMAFSVRGFKEVISGGNFSFMWSNGYVLLGFAVSFMILTLLYFIIKHKKKYSASAVSDAVQE